MPAVGPNSAPPTTAPTPIPPRVDGRPTAPYTRQSHYATTPGPGPRADGPQHGHVPPPAPSATTPRSEPARGRTAPEVRSVTQALGNGRRYVDALLMAGFGILCFVISGSHSATQPGVMIAVGIGALLYSLYIAFSSGGYVMPYLIYALAILGGAFFLFK